MDFGALIPLYFLSMCCFIVTPIVGFSSLAIIRYSQDDKQLARNILLTIIIVAFIAFLYPILGLVWTLIRISLCCPDSTLLSSKVVSEMTLETLKSALFLTIPSLTIGFIIAFVVIVPITLLVRSRKKKKESFEAIS